MTYNHTDFELPDFEALKIGDTVHVLIKRPYSNKLDLRKGTLLENSPRYITLSLPYSSQNTETHLSRRFRKTDGYMHGTSLWQINNENNLGTRRNLCQVIVPTEGLLEELELHRVLGELYEEVRLIQSHFDHLKSCIEFKENRMPLARGAMIEQARLAMDFAESLRKRGKYFLREDAREKERVSGFTH